MYWVWWDWVLFEWSGYCEGSLSDFKVWVLGVEMVCSLFGCVGRFECEWDLGDFEIKNVCFYDFLFYIVGVWFVEDLEWEVGWILFVWFLLGCVVRVFFRGSGWY